MTIDVVIEIQPKDANQTLGFNKMMGKLTEAYETVGLKKLMKGWDTYFDGVSRYSHESFNIPAHLVAGDDRGVSNIFVWHTEKEYAHKADIDCETLILRMLSKDTAIKVLLEIAKQFINDFCVTYKDENESSSYVELTIEVIEQKLMNLKNSQGAA